MLQPGTTLDHDRYRIEAVIGRGGFGYVYRARERLTGETVAIKELVPSFVDDQQMVQRFIQEARATLRLTHTHIARTYGIFEDRGTYYLAMEYLPGGSLADKLKAGPLPVEEAVRIAADLCEALEYAHDKGVVHCDIKPANVLFDETREVCLADFGIAHVSAELLTRQFSTASGTAMGTVRYMAPEQLEGVRDDPRVDIYAVGALLYEMLAGRPYLDFETESTPAAQMRNMQRIQSEPPLPLRAANPTVPEWVAQVVNQALQKTAEDRFPTVRQLRDVLQRDAESRRAPPVPPAPPRESWATQATGWLRNLPVAPAVTGGLAAVALLACSAAVVLYIIRAAPTPPSTPTVTLRPTHSPTPPPPMSPSPSQTHHPPETPTHTPPPDRDDDGVPDDQDRCPDQSGSAELTGCPDSDGDGIPDLDDMCPTSFGLPQCDGCPDSDSDGVPDPDDDCPDSYGSADNYGCPIPESTEPPPTDTPRPDTPPADASAGDTWLRPTDEMVMVYVPAGEFEMGSTNSELDNALELCNATFGNCQRSWFDDEQPAHRVLLHAFWIDRTEVTVSQFAAFVEATGHRTTAELAGVGRVYSSGTGDWREASGADWQHPEGPRSDAQDNHPVVQVGWRDARAYCGWIAGRLPTEAEWEYAARGSERRIYPWGNSYDGRHLNSCDINCPASWRDEAHDDGYGTTAPVASYPSGASWCGALDMAGNVWEWVTDRYGPYPSGTQVDPVGPSTGEGIARGGGWGSMPSSYRTAQRRNHGAELSDDDVGFRCVFVPGE
jgi:serine/threonine-protein kinase